MSSKTVKNDLTITSFRNHTFETVLGVAEPGTDRALVSNQLSFCYFFRATVVLKAVLAECIGPLKSLTTSVAQMGPGTAMNIADMACKMSLFKSDKIAIRTVEVGLTISGCVRPQVTLKSVESVSFVRALIALADNYIYNANFFAIRIGQHITHLSKECMNKLCL